MSNKLDDLKSGSPTPPQDRFFDSIFSLFPNGQGDIEGYIIGGLFVLFIFCIILIPVNIYFGQRHARLCRDELRKQTVILKNIQTDLEFKPEKKPYDKEM